MRKEYQAAALALALLAAWSSSAFADLKMKAAMEVFEFVAKKFGKEAVKEGAEAFTKRFVAAAGRHGEEVVASAVRRSGPQALHAIEGAGTHGGKMARLIASHGDEAIICVAKHPKGMELLAKHGESAGVALCKHKGIAEPLIEKLGEPAVSALAKVEARSGRRLAIMAENGELARIGRTVRLMHTIEKYGDKAMDFIWRNKGKLAVASVLGVFLADPEPFINGTKELLEPVMEVPAKMVDSVVAPLAQAPVKAVNNVTEEMGKRTNWTVLGLAVVAGGGFLILRMQKKGVPRAAEHPA